MATESPFRKAGEDEWAANNARDVQHGLTCGSHARLRLIKTDLLVVERGHSNCSMRLACCASPAGALMVQYSGAELLCALNT